MEFWTPPSPPVSRRPRRRAVAATVCAVAVCVVLASVLPVACGEGVVLLSGKGTLRPVTTGSTTTSGGSNTVGVATTLAGATAAATGPSLLGQTCVSSAHTLLSPSPFTNALYEASFTAGSSTPTWTAIAGSPGQPGTAAGATAAARLGAPAACVSDPSGNVYIADVQNNNIRVLNTDRSSLNVLAGSPTGVSGAVDGSGTSALFCGPRGIAISTTTIPLLYVADGCSYTVREVSTSGVVKTVAGIAGSRGVSATKLWAPFAVVVSTDNSRLFVADGLTVRSVATTGAATLTTLAGKPLENTYTPLGAGTDTVVRAVGLTRESAASNDLIITHQCNNGVILLRYTAATQAITLQSGSLTGAECSGAIAYMLNPSEAAIVHSTKHKATTTANVSLAVAPDEVGPTFNQGWTFSNAGSPAKVNWYLQQGNAVLFPPGIDAVGRQLGDVQSVVAKIQGTVAVGFYRFYTPFVTGDSAGSWYQSSFLFASGDLVPPVPTTFASANDVTLDNLATKVAPLGTATSNSLSPTGVTYTAAATKPILSLSWQTSSTDTTNDWVMSSITFAYTAPTSVDDYRGPATVVLALDKTEQAAVNGISSAARFSSSLGLSAVQLACGSFYSIDATTIDTPASGCAGQVGVNTISINSDITVVDSLVANTITFTPNGKLTITDPAVGLVETVDMTAGGRMTVTNAAMSIARLVLGPSSVLSLVLTASDPGNLITATVVALDGQLSLSGLAPFDFTQGLRRLIIAIPASGSVSGNFRVIQVGANTRSSRNLLQAARTATVACDVAAGGCFATFGGNSKDDGEDNIFIIIALVAAAVVVIILVAIGVVYYHKRRSSSDEETGKRPRPPRDGYRPGVDGSFADVIPEGAEDDALTRSSKRRTYGAIGSAKDPSSSPTSTSSSSSSSSSSASDVDFEPSSERYSTMRKSTSTTTGTTSTTTGVTGTSTTSPSSSSSSNLSS